MEFFKRVWQGASDLVSQLQRLASWLSEFLQQAWNIVPGEDAAKKLIVLGSVLGGLAALPVIYWLWQKWHKTDIDSKWIG